MRLWIRKTVSLLCMLALCVSMTVPAWAAEGNALAGAKTLGDSGTVSGTLTDENKADYYRYTVPAGSSVELNLTLTSYMSSVKVSVYNAGGNETGSKYYYANSSTGQTTENITYYLNPGTYYIGLKRSSGSDGRYTINVSSKKLYNTDTTYDDTIAAAHKLPLTIEVTGMLAAEAEDEIDIYRLDVTEPGTMRYQLKFYMNIMQFKLLDGQGNEIRSKYYYWNSNLKMGTEDFSFALEKGTYYIVVKRDGYNGKYALNQIFTSASSSENEPNNSMETAQTVTLGKKNTGVIAIGGDTDFYKIEVASKRNITFNISFSGVEYLYFYLYDADGNQLKYNSSYYNNNTKKGNLTKIYKLSAGTYYAQLKSYSSGSGTYTLTASTTKAPTKGKITTIKRTKKNWSGNRSIYLKWAKSTNAEGYQIYVATNSKFKNADKYTTTKRTYTTGSYKTGKTYYVKVRGYRKNSDGEYIYGSFSAVKKVKL